LIERDSGIRSSLLLKLSQNDAAASANQIRSTDY